MRRLTLGLIIAAPLLLAACTGGSARHPGTPVRSATTGTSGTPSSATTSPTAPPDAAATARPVPSCTPTSITTRGAPFCFTQPAGFSDYSSLPDYGAGWTYRTIVSMTQHDLVEVLAAGGRNTDTLGEPALRADFDKVFLLKVGSLNIVQAGVPQATTVDGARAFRQLGRYGDGVQTDITTVYRGTSVVSIQCQSLQDPTQVARACASVNATLHLVRR